MGKGGFSLGILIMVMLLLLATSQPGAYGGFLKDLSGDTVIADNMELEFLMDSEISRRLAGGSSPAYDSLNGGKPVIDCGKGIPYKGCVPSEKNNPPKGEHCYTYKRNNPCPKPK